MSGDDFIRSFPRELWDDLAAAATRAITENTAGVFMSVTPALCLVPDAVALDTRMRLDRTVEEVLGPMVARIVNEDGVAVSVYVVPERLFKLLPFVGRLN